MFRVFGDPEKSRGVPVVWGVNPINGQEVSLHLRRVPTTVSREIERRYGRETVVKEGGQLHTTFERTADQSYSLIFDKAVWIWVDATNFVITIEDEKGAEFFREALSDQAIVVGGQLTLDGRLNNRVRRFFVERDQKLALRIIGEAEELEKAEAKQQETLRKN